MKNKIIIVTGDPNSINSEIIYKSWKKIDQSLKKKIFFISNLNLLKEQFKKLNYKLDLIKVRDFNDKVNNFNKLRIMNINLKFKNPFKVSQNSASKFVKSSLSLAHKLAISGDLINVINCPINKKLLKKEKIGVTEYLASKCKLKNHSVVMLIKGRKLSVCPITTHLDLREISRQIKPTLIIKKINTINKEFKRYFKKKPFIGILGLNPHNAELRKNSEEVKSIKPAINNLKKKGIKIDGPLVADMLFINNYKKYDVIVGMYHDQVLIPVKTLDKFNAINITLGLKYLRASPDHGTAENLISKKISNPTSLIECIKFVSKYGKVSS